MGAVYVDAKVDIDDLAEAMTRKQFDELAEAFGSGDVGKDAALLAIAEIRRGDLADAVTTLEREFLPKWRSSEDAEVAYCDVVGRLPFTEKGRSDG